MAVSINDTKVQNFITKRAQDGAKDDTIALELKSIFEAEIPEEKIAQLRIDKNLPSANSANVLASQTTGHVDLYTSIAEETGFDKLLFDAKERPIKNKKVETSFREASATVSEKGGETAVEASSREKTKSRAKKKVPQDIDIQFRPEMISGVKELRKGKTYVFGGLGTVVYLGVEEDTVVGFPLKVAVFIQTNTLSSPLIKKIPVNRVSENSIRLPADRDVMKDVLKKMEFGESTLKPPRVVSSQGKYYDEFINSNDIVKVVDLLLYHYKNAIDLNSTAFKYGEKAMEMIAGEYASVMGMPFKEARRLISDKVGKTKQEVKVPPSPYVPVTP